VTHGSGFDTVRSLHASTSNFALSGGSLTLTVASDLAGDFTLSGGSLLANGVLTTSGTTSWSDGTIQGTGTVHNTGQWTLTGAGSKSLSSTLENAGTVVHGGSANLTMQIGSVPGTLKNLATGVYDLQGDLGFDMGVFNNRGTLRKSAGTGISTSRFGH